MPEPAPAEAPPAETAEDANPSEDAISVKPARKRRAKAKTEEQASEPEAPPAEALPLPAANNDTTTEESGEPRRGWWQRTFG